MIRTQAIKRKRLIYTLDELASGTVVNWRKPVALIGDGESKCRYIFNRDEITVFALNRAARVYPADLMVSSEEHIKKLDTILPAYIPFVKIARPDIEKYKLIGGANAIVFLSFLLQWVERGPVILQGFNFSHSDQPDYTFSNQTKGFRNCTGIARARSINLFMTHENEKLSFLPVKVPDKKLIL